MFKGLADKVAIVTGGATLIGAAVVRAFHEAGVRVTLADIDAEGGARVAAACSDDGRVWFRPTDITQDAEVQACADETAQRFGRVDFLVNLACSYVDNGLASPREEWLTALNVNVASAAMMLQAVVPHMKRGGGGAIVVVSSINGTRTFTTPGATAYAATKAAQLAMVQQLALELGRYRIRVNAVCPGAIETSIDDNTTVRGEHKTAVPVEWPEGEIPITGGEPGCPEDVARLISFLVGDASAHITGTPVWIDGGQGLLR